MPIICNETKGTSQNRVRWRVLVKDLCSTRNKEEKVVSNVCLILDT